jgi:hypothetical protein
MDSLSLDEAVLALRRQQQLLDQERILASLVPTRSMHRLPSGTDLTALLQLQNHRVHQLLLGQAIAPSSSLDLICNFDFAENGLRETSGGLPAARLLHCTDSPDPKSQEDCSYCFVRSLLECRLYSRQ